jgi:hypothetical protein
VKIAKRVLIALVVYVGIVAAFESMIGFLQPQDQSTLVITTTDGDGDSNDRVLAHLESDGKIFVAANHWPRAWYAQALENPNVQVELETGKGDYLAVDLTDEEYTRVTEEHGLPLAFRILTGFPPRYFLRLEPRGPAKAAG